MGREVRRVPATWKHPRNSDGRLIPLRAEHDDRPGEKMPTWPEAERTHWQMYETTSGGTPLTPPCASASDLAKWCAGHYVDAGGGFQATEKEWLAMIEGAGSSPATMSGPGGRPVNPLSLKPG